MPLREVQAGMAALDPLVLTHQVGTAMRQRQASGAPSLYPVGVFERIV